MSIAACKWRVQFLRMTAVGMLHLSRVQASIRNRYQSLHKKTSIRILQPPRTALDILT
jgi:hypothetical protein